MGSISNIKYEKLKKEIVPILIPILVREKLTVEEADAVLGLLADLIRTSTKLHDVSDYIF